MLLLLRCFLADDGLGLLGSFALGSRLRWCLLFVKIIVDQRSEFLSPHVTSLVRPTSEVLVQVAHRSAFKLEVFA